MVAVTDAVQAQSTVGIGDLVLAGVILLFLVFGFRRGVSLGLFTAAGFVLVIVIAVVLAGPLGRVLGIQHAWDEPAASGVGFAILFGVGAIGLLLLRRLVKRGIGSKRAGPLVEGLAGMLVWGALGLLFVLLCLAVLLVSHRDVFNDVAYRHSAACRFIFDEVPVVRDLKARIEKPREPGPPRKRDFEEVGEFRHTAEDDDEGETDH